MTNEQGDRELNWDDERFRHEFFNRMRIWAERNLRGELQDAPFPFLPYVLFHPVWERTTERVAVLEHRLGQVHEMTNAQRINGPLAGDDPGDTGLLKMLVGPLGAPASRDDGIREIRDFTRGAKHLVIADPYAYGGNAGTADAYVEELSKAARIGSSELKSLHIIFSSRHGNTNAIKAGLAERAYSAKVKLTDHDTDMVHDRIWIADGARGLIVGTSFGGLGSRAAFLLPLPNSDLEYILEFFKKNVMLQGTLQQPKRPTRVKTRKKKN